MCPQPDASFFQHESGLGQGQQNGLRGSIKRAGQYQGSLALSQLYGPAYGKRVFRLGRLPARQLWGVVKANVQRARAKALHDQPELHCAMGGQDFGDHLPDPKVGVLKQGYIRKQQRLAGGSRQRTHVGEIKRIALLCRRVLLHLAAITGDEHGIGQFLVIGQPEQGRLTAQAVKALERPNAAHSRFIHNQPAPISIHGKAWGHQYGVPVNALSL